MKKSQSSQYQSQSSQFQPQSSQFQAQPFINNFQTTFPRFDSFTGQIQ